MLLSGRRWWPLVWNTAVVGLLAYWGYIDTGQMASLFGRSNLVSGLLFLAGIVGLIGLSFCCWACWWHQATAVPLIMTAPA